MKKKSNTPPLFFLSLSHTLYQLAMRTSDSFVEPLIREEKKEKKNQYRFDRLFIKRLSGLLKILFDTNKVRLLYVTLICFAIGYEVLVYFVGLIPSHFYSILIARDLSGFIRYTIPCLLLVFTTATVSYYMNTVCDLNCYRSAKVY